MNRLIVAVLGLFLLPGAAWGQTLPDWLNARVDEVVAARLSQRGSGRQVEPPSIARGSTALVDHADFSDLVGLATSALPSTGGGDPDRDARTTALTVTPYALLSALLGVDPDQPFHYERSDAWRSIAVTLGTEEVDAENASVQAALVGLKVRVWSRQDVDPGSPRVGELRNDLGLAGTAFGDLQAAVEDSLFNWIGAQVGLDENDFGNRLASDDNSLRLYLNLVGPERRAILERMIASSVDPFVRLRIGAQAVVEALRGEPQLALQVQSRLEDEGRDEVDVSLAFDVGLNSRTIWTLNGGVTVLSGRESEEAWGGGVATGLTIALGPDRLAGPDPLALDLAFDGQFLDGEKPIWRLQGKFSVPVLEGLSLPLSATWASRTDLVDESEVVGRLGFTIDTARLLAGAAGR